MAREINRLTDRGVAALKTPGMHADGAGLYLRIDQTLNRRWVLIYHWRGKRREMGLGPAAEVKLKAARVQAEDARQALRRGEDPIAARKVVNAEPTTFKMVLAELLTDLRPSWKSAKHKTQWETMLENHCSAMMAMPVADVKTEDVLKALRPIWTTKNITARKIRGRIERVLDAAKAQGLREGENPARWRGHLDSSLARAKPATRHQPAMAYNDLPAFMADLAAKDCPSARALRWTILTAGRTSQTIGGTQREIEADLWTIPGERMKLDRDHRVPLTAAMQDCLTEGGEPADFLFEGASKLGGLSTAAMSELLKDMRPGMKVTVHGFRSTFRDWAGDRTDFARETIEAALAHQVGDNTERAYRRGDALEKRRRLMEVWSDFCLGNASGKLLQFVR